MKRCVILASLVAILAIPAARPVHADVPVKINYRGWLEGYPSSTVTETLVFRLYDGPTASSAIRSFSKSVDIYDGNFSVVLEFQPGDFSAATRYIGVFKSDGTTELTSPRPQVLSVPYAYQAGNLYSTSDGKVGIGTVTPAEKLDVVGRIRTSDGIVFGDGSVQSAAVSADGHSLDAADGSPANVVYVDSAGRVGVGTTGPSGTLHVNGSGGWTEPLLFLSNPSYGNTRIIQAGDGLIFRNYYASGSQNAFSFRNSSDTRLMVIGAGGRVGIGTYSPSAMLEVAGDAVVGPLDVNGNAVCTGSGSFVGLSSTDGLSVREGAPPPAGAGLDFHTYGGVVINWRAPTSLGIPYGMRVATYDQYGYPLSAGYYYIDSRTGNLTYATNFSVSGDGSGWLRGTLTQNSDARLKEDIEPLSGCLDKVMNLQGVTYNWKPDETGRDREDTQFGFLGQELHEVIPELAPVDDEGHYGIVYDRLIPVMVEAMKEQQGIIENQKAQLDALGEQMKRLEEKMSRLETAREARN